jgi:hypothetical protein
MAIELLEDKKRWDQFVETSPQGLLFPKWDSVKTVERHSRHRFLIDRVAVLKRGLAYEPLKSLKLCIIQDGYASLFATR